jgi:hypothetical protein
MSQVKDKITSLDTEFPIAGINNSSEGFRANYRSIKTAFETADTELSKLQKTFVSVTGDLTGTSSVLNLATADSTNFNLALTLTLPSVHYGPTTLDTAVQDFKLTLDAKGRVTVSQVTTHTTVWDEAHTIGTTMQPTITSMGSGSGTLDLPVFAFDALGRLSKTGIKNITYGLTGHTLAEGALIAGKTGNASGVVAAPSGTSSYILTIQNKALSWAQFDPTAGSVSDITAGDGIAVNNTGGTSTISLDIGGLTQQSDIQISDMLVWHDVSASAPKKISFSQLQTKMVEVVVDTTPQLGGDLDTQSFAIGSSTGILRLKNASGIAATTLTLNDTAMLLAGPSISIDAPEVALNGSKWPTTVGAAGQSLAMGSGNQLEWTNAFSQTIENTVFVSSNGDDTLGNGSLNSPYQTIAKALTQVPNNDSTKIYTIMLLGGTYVENPVINGKRKITIEGFFGSSNAVIKGTMVIVNRPDIFHMSKITLDGSDLDASDDNPVFTLQTGAGEGLIRNCEILRGDNALSDKNVILLNGDISQDFKIIDTKVQGKITNSTTSSIGGRVVVQNLILPENGWTGFVFNQGSNSYVSGVPLVKGIGHLGGQVVLENLSSIIPETYTVSTSVPSLPKWAAGNPLFFNTNFEEVEANDPYATGSDSDLVQVTDTNGDPITVDLLDDEGNPIPDTSNPGEYLQTPWVQVKEDQDPIVETFEVGIYSDTDTTGDLLEVRNVDLYYQGAISKVYKSGSCPWLFSDVKRRADQDFIRGPRIALESSPDSGEFLPYYLASGTNLTHQDTGTIVPGGVIDPDSGRTFHVTLNSSSTVTLRSPDALNYNPGPQLYSGEQITELLLMIKQNNTGGNQLTIATDGTPITWISGNQANKVPNGLTFYRLRWLARQRRWIAQRSIDKDFTVRTSSTVTKTLALTDAGDYLRTSNAVANQVIVPTNASVPFDIGTEISIVQAGPGQTQIVPASGVIIYTPIGYYLRARYSRALLVKVGPNTWELSGDLDTSQLGTNTTTIDDETSSIDSSILTIDNA